MPHAARTLRPRLRKSAESSRLENAARLSGADTERLIKLGMITQMTQREFTALYSSLGGVMLVIFFITATAAPMTLLAIISLRAASIGINHILAIRLARALENDQPFEQPLTHLSLAMGLAATMWSLMVWPFPFGTTINLPTFLLVLIALIAISMQVVTTACYRPAMRAVLVGGAVGFVPKILFATQMPLILLPAFLLFLLVLASFGHQLSRQARRAVVLQLRNHRMSRRLVKANQTLNDALARTRWLADRDTLTKLRNRRAISNELAPFTAQHSHQQISLMIIDIDHFKSINDRFGHDTGDGVLLAVGTCLTQWESDAPGRLVGRWGGEEFMALCAARPGEDSAVMAEDLRARLELLGPALDWPGELVLTASIGCADLKEVGDFEEALSRADAALYRAKQAGRNCWKLAA